MPNGAVLSNRFQAIHLDFAGFNKDLHRVLESLETVSCVSFTIFYLPEEYRLWQLRVIHPDPSRVSWAFIMTALMPDDWERHRTSLWRTQLFPDISRICWLQWRWNWSSYLHRSKFRSRTLQRSRQHLCTLRFWSFELFVFLLWHVPTACHMMHLSRLHLYLGQTVLKVGECVNIKVLPSILIDDSSKTIPGTDWSIVCFL